MAESLVDIILPLYNPTSFVFDSINSVLYQSFQDWNLFIIDDASTNNILPKIQSHYISYSNKIRYIKFDKNNRAAACRNYAVSQGKSKYIAFIDQDDIWDKNKLQIQIQYIENLKYDAVHGNLQFINNKSEIFLENQSELENQSRKATNWSNQTELTRNIFLNPNIRLISSMLTRDIFEKINGFHEGFFGGEDEMFWFEISKKGRIGYIDKVLFYRREHDSNTYIKFKINRLFGYLDSLDYLYKVYKCDIQDIYHQKKAMTYYNILRYYKQYKLYGTLLTWFLKAIIDFPYNLVYFVKIKKKTLFK